MLRGSGSRSGVFKNPLGKLVKATDFQAHPPESLTLYIWRMCSFNECSLVILMCDLNWPLRNTTSSFLLRSQCISKKLLSWIVFFLGHLWNCFLWVIFCVTPLPFTWDALKNFVKASCICKENYPRHHSITSSPRCHHCSQVTMHHIFLLEFGIKENVASLEKYWHFLKD